METKTQIELSQNSVKAVTLDELRVLLALFLTGIGNDVVKVALIVAEFHRRGEDEGLPRSFRNMLLRIASGQMLPDVYVLFKESACRKIGMLPIAEQRELCDGKPIQCITADGEPLLIAPCDLSPSQERQVFAADGLRSASQQRAWLESAKTAAMLKQRPMVDSEPRVDVKNKVVYINGHAFTKQDLLRLAMSLP